MLDNPGFVTRYDPMGMARLISEFGTQLKVAYDICVKTQIPEFPSPIENIIVTGLGGSAAGGDLLAALITAEGTIPCYVNRDYNLPNWAGPNTLVFVCSYSGNTEETLSAYAEARKRGCKMIAVTSGGQLLEKATEDSIGKFVVPGGQPPRTALGFMFLPLVTACERLGVIGAQDWQDVHDSIATVAAAMGLDSAEESNSAKQIARSLHGKFPIFYASDPVEFAVAQRWRAQVNENSKIVALTHAYPELCHNEILGWEGSGGQGVDSFVGVLLLGETVTNQMRTRIQATEDLIRVSVQFGEVSGYGETRLARMLSLCYVSDWVSIYLAALNGVDPGQMDSITDLKKRLS